MAAVENNDRIGSVLFAEDIRQWIPPRKGRKHVLRQISDLLTHDKPGKGSDLGLALRTTMETMKRRGICVILSDFRTTGYWDELAIAARRHDVIAIRITDPLDSVFPLFGLVELQDPESGRSIKAYGRSSRFRKEYSDFWELEQIQWIKGCRKLGVDTLEISTEDDTAMKLAQFFSRRKKNL